MPRQYLEIAIVSLASGGLLLVIARRVQRFAGGVR